MPAHPITLGPMHFAKKGDALAYLKQLLYKYDLGDRLSDSHSEILMAALNRHPEAKDKIGAGVASFSVRTADFGSRCFWVNRTDGTTEKFSLKACVWH
jgi:hypothetical protein